MPLNYKIFLFPVLLMTVVQLHSQKMPQFWYEDNNMRTAGGFPPDFTQMFTDPSQWENLRDTLSVYLVRGNTLNNIIKQEGEDFIKDYFAPVLVGANLPLAIDNPPSVSIWPDFYKLLTDNGITVSHVGLQSVLSKPRNDVSPQYDPELSARILEVKNDIKAYHQTAPDVKYGIIDARPTKGWEYKDAYLRTRDALRSIDLDLDFILLDCPYSYPLAGTKITWTEMKEVEAYVMNTLEAEFGWVITDNVGGMQSDQAFYNSVMAYASAYDKSGTVPDFFILMSWFDHPSRALPEDAPAGEYPMSKVGLELFHYLGGYYEPLGLQGPDSRSPERAIDIMRPMVYSRDKVLVIDHDKPVIAAAVYNIMGQQVKLFRGGELSNIHLGNIVPGIYFVQIQDAYTSFSSRIYVPGE